MNTILKIKKGRDQGYLSLLVIIIIIFSGSIFYLVSCEKETTSPTATLATLTTSEATEITQTTAKCGGYISKDGGSAVTTRGLCWSAGPNPSVSNNKSDDGSGTGDYVRVITGLLPNTKYYVRAYAINSSGTAYGNQITFVTSLVPVNTVQLRLDSGETPKHIFDSGIPLDSLYGKTYMGGMIFYLNTSSGYGLVAASTNQGSVTGWGCYGTLIAGADGTAIGTGAQNTVDIEAGCSATNIAAHVCANLTLNTYTDWFLPSKDELNEMYTHLYLKGLGAFTAGSYWTSSENNNNTAWQQNFTNGGQVNADKSNVFYVRAIRAF